MKKTEDCFLKVKSDYLNFLKKEKIFDQSKKAKIESLKKVFRIIFNTSVIVVFPEPCPQERPKNKVFPFSLYFFSIQNDIGI